MIGKLFVVFLIALLAFQHHLLKKRVDGRAESKSKIKNERLLFSLRRCHFGNALSDTTRHILNLSNYNLSDTKSFFLSHVLNFRLPPRYLCKEEIFAEFESL